MSSLDTVNISPYTLLMDKVCAICLKPILKSSKESYAQWESRKSCSLSCGAKLRVRDGVGHIYKRGHQVSIETRKKIGEANRGHKSANWKGGRTGDGNGYIRVMVDGKYVLEHRHIMQLALNRKLTKNEHVHHINGVKHDNRFVNLVVMNKSDHHKIHRKVFLCSVDNCERQHRAKGFCGWHYTKDRRKRGLS